MKNTLFVSENEYTTNIIALDEDVLFESMESALHRKNGLTDSMQQDILSRAFTSYEVQNEYRDTFINVFPGLKDIKFLDENRSKTHTFRISDRTEVTIRPILIPLEKINPNKPLNTAVIVHQVNGTNNYVGKHVEGKYEYDSTKVENEDNCIAIICNGAFIRKGQKNPKNKNFEQNEMSM